MRKTFSLQLLSILLLFSITAGAINARASQLPDPDEVKALLVQLVDVEKRAPGIVVGMIAADPQESWVIGYGKLSATDTRVPDGDTVFEIGSISKGFTGTLLAQEVLNGEVKLDDPISLYLPEGVVAPEYGGRPIMLIDLATHTSGLPTFHTSNPFEEYTVDQMYADLSEFTLTRAPGTICEYSNYGFGLLGNLLARSANQADYETLLLERICRPLGMNSTRIQLTPEMRSRAAAPHDNHLQPSGNYARSAFAGAGGIRSTTNDMLKLLAANIGVTETELQPAIQMANTPYFQKDAFGYMGLGWVLGQTSKGMIHSHNGNTGGFYSYISWNSQSKVGVVILTNAAISIDDIGNQLLLGITSGQPIPQIIEIILASWAIITAGCAAILVWILRRQPISLGARLMWLLTTLFLGPLGLVFYWATVEQPKHSGVALGAVSLGRRALVSAAWAAAGNVVGGIGVLALQPYLNNDILMQIAVSLLIPLFVGWLLFTVSRWLSRSEAEHDFLGSRPFFAEVVSTCLVLVGLYPVVYFSIIRWINLWALPFGGWYQNIQFYPLLWGLLCLGTISGTLVAYPFHLWMLRRGFFRWGSEGVLSKGSVKGIAWYKQITLMVLSIICMLAAIFLTMQVA